MLRFTTFTTVGPYRHPLLRAVVDALKYDGIQDLAVPLGAHLAQNLKPLIEKTTGHELTIIPIPLHPKRLRERGYNQSELLARATARELQLPVRETLIRVRPTAQQVKLPREERLRNVENAFAVLPNTALKGKTVLLIDDVITTGATMRDAARALRHAGAREVWAAAVAQG